MNVNNALRQIEPI